MPVEVTTTHKVRVSITGPVKFQPGTVTATVEDPNIAAITLDPNDREAEISGLRAGSTKFTISGRTENSPSGAPGRTVSESDTITVAESATALGFAYGTPVPRDASDAAVVVEPAPGPSDASPFAFQPSPERSPRQSTSQSEAVTDPHELLGKSPDRVPGPASTDPHELLGKSE